MISSDITIEVLRAQDFLAVDVLASKFKKTLGFFPKDAILTYLRTNGVLGAIGQDGQLLGYVMFARYEDRIRIAQICVDEVARGRGIARKLIDYLKRTATTEKIIRLRCRRDYGAHSFWTKIGFVPFDEKAGRSAEGHLLTTFGMVLDGRDELALWTIQTEGNVRHCVIDAQIFFDFYEPESQKSIPSKSLLNDFLADSLSLWITDEMFVEIGRCRDEDLRANSRQRAHGFQRIDYKPDLSNSIESSLKAILPSETPNKLSDIRQLAKAAASEADIFITRDDRLLGLREEIRDRTGLTVVTPHEIILSMHHEGNVSLYSPSLVSGLSLRWERITSEIASEISLQDLLIHGESSGKFRELLNGFLAQPNRFCCEILQSGSESVALRIFETESSSLLDIKCVRLVKRRELPVFAAFLLADSINVASMGGRDSVKVSLSYEDQAIITAARKLGFYKQGNCLLKPVLTCCLSRTESLEKINTITNSDCSQLSDLSLEHMASPLVVCEETPTFLISIRPSYARQMIDTEAAAGELFEEKSSVLLRADNVYYKKKSSHKMLQSPGRILWYVSGESPRIIAISRLNEVNIGKPKELFKKYSRFGVLEWRDLFHISEHQLDRDIMALRFSQTHSFRTAIPREQLLKICKEEGFNLALPSPTRIPYKAVRKLYALGF